MISKGSVDMWSKRDLRSKEGGKDVANEATNTVNSEDVERIVASEKVL